MPEAGRQMLVKPRFAATIAGGWEFLCKLLQRFSIIRAARQPNRVVHPFFGCKEV
jgi:hypothetical protein